MEWFLEIFDDTSDRARFFAILISSIVAVSVVLLNKHLERKAARRDLLIEKLEEIANELQSISYLSRPRKRTNNTVMIEQEKLLDIQTSIDRVRVLCVLYFPAFKSNFSQCNESIDALSMNSRKVGYRSKTHLVEKTHLFQIREVSANLLVEVIQHMQEIRH